ncbi:MAG: hypothetical protein CVT81_09295 [Alphaproteobacteria bacterium HGW-Alphaproteobacteria-3]|nr:MAG: hypothetical protein CVT81_09295 [Alphaproteobacteria bacterium HGW-Alphaproteobacteria-3]
MRKLPVIRSVSEVFSGVTRHYFQLAFLALPAVLVLLFVSAYQYWILYKVGFYSLAERMSGREAPGDIAATYGKMLSAIPWAQIVPVILIGALASAIAAVRWHRFVLLGDGSSPILRREDLQYLWTTVKVLFFLFLFFVVVSAGGGIVIAVIAGAAAGAGDDGGFAELGLLFLVLIPLVLVGYALMIGVTMRLLLALPAVAVGADGGVIETWHATSGNTWRIAGYTLLIYIPMFVVFAILERLILGTTEAMTDNGGMVIAAMTVLLGIVLYLYFLMTQITMLSVAYREIVGLPGGHEGEATVAEPSPGL